ncbi:MAG: hypothetical protein AAGC46_00975 [Solirubrobacteraceae bacterium]|nr:hypothetical protein [Patulibacter sp.]
MNVAYVLLPEAALPDPDVVAQAFAGLFPSRGPLVPTAEEPATADGPPAFGLACADGMVHVILQTGPVEGGEAERAERRSLAAIGSDEPLPDHHAHLVVAWFPAEGAAPDEVAIGQARATAAVALATDATGVYVPAASATHPAAWYVEVAREVEEPMMLWIGVSHVLTDEQRHEFLSFGMQQFGLPELLLTAPLSDGGDAIEYFYELVGASSKAGVAIVPGEIVGREPGELLTAREAPNPVDGERPLIAIDLPG